MRLIIIGGGAAGIFCAVNAARLNPSLEVIVLEKSGKLLSKVRISGGGRCNVTHACFSIPDMVKRYPRGANFVKKTFHWFFTTDTINWFKEREVELKTEKDGRMFPVSDNSETIIRCLLNESDKYGVKIWMNRDVREIQNVGGKWKLVLQDDQYMDSDYVYIATGGYPKSSMFEWLVKTGHTVETPVPSLFTFNMPANPIVTLMGITVPDAHIKIKGLKLAERGPLLITHWGLSGPAVLKLSAWAARELHELNYEFTILINWVPEYNENTLRDRLISIRQDEANAFISSRNVIGLPQRLWDFLLEKLEIKSSLRWADLTSVKLNHLVKVLTTNEMNVKGKTTFKEEFVTAGGIQLSEIEPNTMESRLHPNLFFGGEVMNVDGVTGGFNFQHAWTSGWIAAKTIAEKANSRESAMQKKA